jgi:hypothetical protein
VHDIPSRSPLWQCGTPTAPLPFVAARGADVAAAGRAWARGMPLVPLRSRPQVSRMPWGRVAPVRRRAAHRLRCATLLFCGRVVVCAVVTITGGSISFFNRKCGLVPATAGWGHGERERHTTPRLTVSTTLCWPWALLAHRVRRPAADVALLRGARRPSPGLAAHRKSSWPLVMAPLPRGIWRRDWGGRASAANSQARKWSSPASARDQGRPSHRNLGTSSVMPQVLSRVY